MKEQDAKIEMNIMNFTWKVKHKLFYEQLWDCMDSVGHKFNQ